VRRVLVLVGLTLALAFGAASAQPDPEGRPIEPGHHMPQPQIMNEKPSGFRMDGTPAKGGAYRYRLMIVGGFCVMLTAGLVARYLRKINRERAAQ
jgi:hypothetical protein